MKFTFPTLGKVTIRRHGVADPELEEYYWRVEVTDIYGDIWRLRFTCTDQPLALLLRTLRMVGDLLEKYNADQEGAQEPIRNARSYAWHRMAEQLHMGNVHPGQYCDGVLWYRTVPFTYDAESPIYRTKAQVEKYLLEPAFSVSKRLVFVYPNDMDIPRWVCLLGPRGGVNWTKW